MSRLSLTTNVASLNAQRNLSQATKNLETSFSRLSSGMRINRASDDAAGLSVASLLSADRAVLAQGIRNLNDGISYLNIAEGAITELTNIMFRIQEIAEQSANGTLSSAQRKPLQDEVTALQSEYNRIIRSTKFNDMQLLTGANTLVNLQGGYGVVGGLAVQVGNALVSDAFGLYSAGETVRVNTSSSGGEANGQSHIMSVSVDGRYVVFGSSANNLIPGVSGGQIYVKDTQTGELSLGSSAQDGEQANSSNSSGKLSADGRYLVFQSFATNLLSGISGGHIYIKDLHTGELRLGSSTQDGIQGNSTSLLANISGDGRFVSFTSTSTNLIPGVSGQQVYVKDLQTGKLYLGSGTQGDVQGNGSSNEASLSADGRFISFLSLSTNFFPGASGQQAYVKDLQTGEVKLVSSTKDGVQGNSDSGGVSMSADGRFVVFTSSSTNLFPGVSGSQVYIKNLQTGELYLGSSSQDGVHGNLVSNQASISADGRYVSFTSNSSNFIPGISGYQVYRKDLESGKVELASRSTNGESDANNGSIVTVMHKSNIISPDGNTVYFISTSNNLVEGDTNGVLGHDVFSRDMSKTGIDELAGMVVSNQASARTTLTLSRQRLETLNLARAGIGASTSRIDTAISNLSTMTQNFASAASQITDTDVAEESAKLAAGKILQEAGAAVLKLANQQPELVLALLKDI